MYEIGRIFRVLFVHGETGLGVSLFPLSLCEFGFPLLRLAESAESFVVPISPQLDQEMIADQTFALKDYGFGASFFHLLPAEYAHVPVPSVEVVIDTRETT